MNIHTYLSRTCALTCYIKFNSQREASGGGGIIPIFGPTQRSLVTCKRDQLLFYRQQSMGLSGKAPWLVTARAWYCDNQIRRFLDEHPDGVIVEFGGGMDARYFRVTDEGTERKTSTQLECVGTSLIFKCLDSRLKVICMKYKKSRWLIRRLIIQQLNVIKTV